MIPCKSSQAFNESKPLGWQTLDTTNLVRKEAAGESKVLIKLISWNDNVLSMVRSYTKHLFVLHSTFLYQDRKFCCLDAREPTKYVVDNQSNLIFIFTAAKLKKCSLQTYMVLINLIFSSQVPDQWTIPGTL